MAIFHIDPFGAEILYAFSVGADARHRPARLPFEGSWTRSGLRGGCFSCKHKSICRGRRCGVAQRSMPQWGIEPHERAGFAGWRPSFWPPSADAPDGLTINCHQQPQGHQQYPTVGADSISACMGRQHKLRTGHRGRCTLQINVHIL